MLLCAGEMAQWVRVWILSENLNLVPSCKLHVTLMPGDPLCILASAGSSPHWPVSVEAREQPWLGIGPQGLSIHFLKVSDCSGALQVVYASWQALGTCISLPPLGLGLQMYLCKCLMHTPILWAYIPRYCKMFLQWKGAKWRKFKKHELAPRARK